MTRPAVVVVRDPDCSNDITLYGLPPETRVFDVDLGRSDLYDPGECVEWAHGLMLAVDLDDPGPADEQVLGLVGEMLGRHTVRATFRPEAWQNDVAIEVDPEGPVEWDVTDAFWELTDRQRLQILGEVGAYVFNDNEDWFHDTPGQPEWARQWGGPFTIEIEVV